jgi:class 3 adenylate cyclase
MLADGSLSPIVERMRRGETVIADRIAEATVLFSDLVDFTSLTARVSPEQTVALLGDLFSRFDALAARHGLEKIKTTGDGYMVAGGLPEERADHAVAVAEMALAMLDAVDTAGRTAGQPLQLRIGLDTGALIAGVLGTHKFVYDVWGDTMNAAKHMESYPVEPGHVHVSATTRRALGDAFRFRAARSARYQRQRVDGDLFRLSSEKRGRHPVRDAGLAGRLRWVRSRPSRPSRRHAALRAWASSRAFRQPSPRS